MKRGLEILSISAIAVLIACFFSYAMLSGNAVSTSVQVKVTVLPLYKIFMQTFTTNKVVTPGSSMPVKIILWKTNTSATSDKITVELKYEILKGSHVVEKGTFKNITLDKKQVTRTDTIKIPRNFANFYTLKITATSPQAYQAETSSFFFVRNSFFWWWN